MATIPRTVEISVAGRKFLIKTDKDPDYVKHLASKLDQMVVTLKSGKPNLTFDKVLVIVCLYLLDENENLRTQLSELPRAPDDDELADILRNLK